MTVSNKIRPRMEAAMGGREEGVEVTRILDSVMVTDAVWGTPTAEDSNASTVSFTPKGPAGQPYSASADTTLIAIPVYSTGAVAMTSALAVDVGTLVEQVALKQWLWLFTPADLDATNGVATFTITTTNAGVAAATAVLPGGKAKTVSKTFA